MLNRLTEVPLMAVVLNDVTQNRSPTGKMYFCAVSHKLGLDMKF